jgi:hypothetical protein
MERVMTKIAFERWPARLVATALDMNSNVRRARPQPEASDEFKLKKQRQGIAFNLSAKRRLCNTVGGRFIDGTACCCAVSTARSRAATNNNLARAILALVLRALFGAAKSCALVNLFMICPQWSADG